MDISVLKKPNFSSEICVEREVLNLSAIIFDINLYIALHNDIVLKSLKDLGLSTLGISTMEVELKLDRILPEVLVSLITLNGSSPNTSMKAKRISAVHPSRPMILSFLHLPSVSYISSMVTGANRFSYSSEFIHIRNTK